LRQKQLPLCNPAAGAAGALTWDAVCVAVVLLVAVDERVAVREGVGVWEGVGMAQMLEREEIRWSTLHSMSSCSRAVYTERSSQLPSPTEYRKVPPAGRHLVLPGVLSTGPSTMRPRPAQTK
jgi:hypothetical protein